nr:hypothetical protein [Bradyrhizobium diazoefficiens]
MAFADIRLVELFAADQTRGNMDKASFVFGAALGNQCLSSPETFE